MQAAPKKVVNRATAPVIQRAFRPAAAPSVQVRVQPGSLMQAALRVSSPSDPAEREAEQNAQRIMRMPEPVKMGSISPPSSGPMMQSPYLARFAGRIIQREKGVAREAVSPGKVEPNVAAEISASQSGGSELPTSVRRMMEPRFGARFDRVRVHTGDRAAKLNRQVSARAFTVGNQIFFGGGQFQPESQEGRELIAHELTHTIQQGAAVQAIQRSEDVTVSQRCEPQVQRLGMNDALNYFAEQANNIPGFRMFTIVLGMNPINMSGVDRSPANIMRAIVEFLPGGGLITQALDNHGVFDKVGNRVAQQIASLGMVGGAIKQGIDAFLKGLSWSDIFNLGSVWERAKSIFTAPIGQLISFAKGLVTGIITFIKDAILMPIASLAQGTPSYELLCAVLGKDPITDKPVPQNADTLIGGFMKLIGQSDVWENMKKANAVSRAFAWFKGALSSLLGFLRQIPTLFVSAFKALEIMDIVLVPRAFAKLVGVFGNFVASFIQWAGNAVWNLLEIVVDSVSPGAFGYIKRTGAALKSILKNPLPFVGNLIKAAKLGFQNFAGNFGSHLKAGLIDWLTGSLAGVYIPKAFSLVEVGKFVLSILGITWAGIRAKIVKVLGPTGETIMKGLETTFDVVVALVTGGPAAAWEIIKEKLTNLKDMVIGGIMDLVIDAVVKKAVPKLIAMFIPGAGFISAILSIYDTVMVFVQKISKIIQVVNAFIASIVAIAGGAIGAAAGRVERILAGLLSLAISFLAGFAGLGKIADKIMGVINKVRASVDKAIDTAIAWIVSKAKSLFAKLFAKKGDMPEEGPDTRTAADRQRDLHQATQEAGQMLSSYSGSPNGETRELAEIQKRFRLKVLRVVKGVRCPTLHAEINPIEDLPIVLSVNAAVRALRQGASEVAVRSLGDARSVLSQAFPEATQSQGPTAMSVFPSAQQVELIREFRAARGTRLQFHIDTDRISVTTIRAALTAELVGARLNLQLNLRELAKANQRYHRDDQLGQAEVQRLKRNGETSMEHVRRLEDFDRAWETQWAPRFRVLERESATFQAGGSTRNVTGVLQGHETVKDNPKHRFLAHINVEGVRVTDGSVVKAVIFIV